MIELIKYISDKPFFGKNFLRKIFRFYLTLFPIRYLKYWLFLNPQDTGMAMQLIENIYESYSNDVISELLKKGSTIVDVGAHVGSNTLFFSKIAGDNGHVFCFEPDPQNFNLLKKNLYINGIKNVSAYRVAISDRKGKAKLYPSVEETTDHRISDSNLIGRKIIKVQCDSLDNLLRKIKNVNLIKIDVQGWEIKCLQGMKDIVRKNKDFILIIEYWPRGLREAGFVPESLIDLLKKMRLKLYILDENKRKILVVKDSKILNKYTESDGFVNLLCKK